MRWLNRKRWKASIALAGLLLLLIRMVWVPVSAAGASERALGLATLGTGTVQTTPTEDATVTALQKEQLTLQDDKIRNDNAWAWLSPVSTILGPLATIGTILVGILVARNNFLQWSKNRGDEQKKREDDQRIEREKRDEERFQKVVEGLGSERTEAKVGAAIILRTFLQPGYERFYRQAFDLAVSHLRLRKAEASALDSLSQALITVFKESFPLARNELIKLNDQFDPRLLDTTNIRLDHAHLAGADLVQALLERTFLRKAELIGAHLEGANLNGAHLEGANLNGAHLEGADFSRAQIEGANLFETHLEGANLFEAHLEGANIYWAHLEGANLNWAHLEGAKFSGAHLEGADFNWAQLEGADPEKAASLKDTKMNEVFGLTPEQREECIKKGANFDGIFDDIELLPTSDTSSPSSLLPAQSNSAQALLTPPAQANTPPPGIDGNSAPSSQRDLEP